MDQTKLDAIGNQYGSVLDAAGSGNTLRFDMTDQDVPINDMRKCFNDIVALFESTI